MPPNKIDASLLSPRSGHAVKRSFASFYACTLALPTALRACSRICFKRRIRGSCARRAGMAERPRREDAWTRRKLESAPPATAVQPLSRVRVVPQHVNRHTLGLATLNGSNASAGGNGSHRGAQGRGNGSHRGGHQHRCCNASILSSGRQSDAALVQYWANWHDLQGVADRLLVPSPSLRVLPRRAAHSSAALLLADARANAAAGLIGLKTIDKDGNGQPCHARLTYAPLKL